MTLSHTFFSTCITSIQCLISRPDQYKRIKKINLFFHMQVLLFFLLLGLSKYSIQVLNPLEDLFTIQRYGRSFVLLTSIKNFFQLPVRVMRFQKTPMPSVDYFSTMFQLYVACVFFTDGACKMTLNTVTAQIPICWKVINGTKKHCTHLKSLILKPIKH